MHLYRFLQVFECSNSHSILIQYDRDVDRITIDLSRSNSIIFRCPHCLSRYHSIYLSLPLFDLLQWPLQLVACTHRSLMVWRSSMHTYLFFEQTNIYKRRNKFRLPVYFFFSILFFFYYFSLNNINPSILKRTVDVQWWLTDKWEWVNEWGESLVGSLIYIWLYAFFCPTILSPQSNCSSWSRSSPWPLPISPEAGDQLVSETRFVFISFFHFISFFFLFFLSTIIAIDNSYFFCVQCSVLLPKQVATNGAILLCCMLRWKKNTEWRHQLNVLWL